VRLASRFALALVGAAILASLAVPATARAMGAIVSSPPGASSAVGLRFAVAASETQGAPSARWASVTVQGSATAFAWIVPARPGALLELSPDAWLEALEAATAPRVVPPDTTPPCGFSGGAEVEGSFTPTVTTAPGAVVVAADRPTLDATLASWGLSVTPELSPAIDAAIASGSDLVAMLFTDASGTVVTRTLRVVDAEPAGVPLSLLTGGANPVQVTAFALTASSTAFGTQPDLTVDPTAILWRSDGTSSYASVRDATLDANPGRWLLETSAASLVSTPTTLPDGATVPSLTSAYDSLAANGGDAGISDDLALALGLDDAGTRNAWLARARTVIAAGSLGQDAPLTGGELEAIGPVVTAAGYAQTCGASAPPSQPPQQGSSGSSAAPSSQGTSSGAAVDLGAGAATAAADSTDGCGGDSSDSSGDSCGGDTTSSSEGSDSSSSDSGGGCGGSTTGSSSDSGSGCSGSSDSSSSGDCSVQDGAGRGRPRRSGASRFLVLLVGIAALWRRRRSV
jgi:hypothetical protein